MNYIITIGNNIQKYNRHAHTHRGLPLRHTHTHRINPPIHTHTHINKEYPPPPTHTLPNFISSETLRRYPKQSSLQSPLTLLNPLTIYGSYHTSPAHPPIYSFPSVNKLHSFRALFATVSDCSETRQVSRPPSFRPTRSCVPADDGLGSTISVTVATVTSSVHL